MALTCIPNACAEELDRYRPAYGALVVPFPKLKQGTLFAIEDERDRAAHDRISELIEDIVAAAPRRIDDSNPTRRAKDFKVGADLRVVAFDSTPAGVTD